MSTDVSYASFSLFDCHLYVHNRAVGRSENLGVPVLFGRHNLPPLVEIGLTDLPKFGGAMAPPAPPGTTGLSASSKQDCSSRSTREATNIKDPQVFSHTKCFH